MTTAQVETARRGGIAAERRDLGHHWTLLEKRATSAILNATEDRDPELLAMMEEHFDSVPDDPHRSPEQILIRCIARFLDRVGQRVRDDGFEARDAAMYLARVDWDEDQAFNLYLDEVDPRPTTTAETETETETSSSPKPSSSSSGKGKRKGKEKETGEEKEKKRRRRKKRKKNEAQSEAEESEGDTETQGLVKPVRIPFGQNKNLDRSVI